MTRRLAHFQIATLLILCIFFSQASAGKQEQRYNRINLSVSATAEIENDTLVAQLYVQKEGRDASQLTKQTNQDIDWAIQQAKQIPGITVQTLDYHTSPTYRKQSQDGWRVRQSLRLTSQDALVMSQLVGTLQQRLMVDHIGYKISQKKRDEAENRLITQAISAFKTRAKLISTAWEQPSYRLVSMNVNTSGRTVQPMFKQRAMMMSEASSAPALERGKQTVQVTARGTIELQKH